MAGGMDPWRARVFAGVALCCGLFVLLTGAAMLAYPGGTYTDPASRGFSLFNNFLSDLARTRTRLGAPQDLCRWLFTTALLLVAAGMAAFFVAYATLARATRAGWIWSRLGSALGVAAAACFAGVALVPADLNLALHDQLVQWAFRCFLAAVLCYLVALPGPGELPPRFRRALLAFAVVLAGYVVLITYGPSPHAPEGQTLQATGQKLIVLAAVACVGVQSLWAWHRLSCATDPTSAGP